MTILIEKEDFYVDGKGTDTTAAPKSVTQLIQQYLIMFWTNMPSGFL